mgnify:CR=1 FL=1
MFLSSSGNFKNKPAVIYKKCEIIGSSDTQNTDPYQSAATREFNNLSNCDKKYIQQFLKGHDLYLGAIDGAWGEGTVTGLTQLSKKGKLKGETLESIIKKLSQNPICD